MEEKLYWLGFSVFPGVGPKRFGDLLSKFNSAENAWKAEINDLEMVLGRVIALKFSEFRKSFRSDVYFQKLIDKKVNFLTLIDDKYPSLLREIKDSPFVLYYKGNPSNSSGQKIVAVVGTRKITSYGREVTEQITRELVSAGFTIVSGLAYGVDACAHKTTIDSGGKTIAVLGCGVDCCYPRTNQKIYDQIIETKGAIVSEFPIEMQPSVGSFPSRNRIIAGLSQAVIVTEGASDSGALYTANDALKLRRPAFAVPGPITSQLSKGPNSLIAKGAKLVSSTEDILRELGTTGSTSTTSITKEIKGDTEDEQMVIDLLQNENLHFDELVRKTKMGSSQLGTLLSLMEMKGVVRASEGIFALI